MKKLIFIVFLMFSANLFSQTTSSILTHQKIRKVLLVVAMDKEALPIIQALHLQKQSKLFSGLPMQMYSGKYQGHNIFLVRNGEDPKLKVQNIGSQAATLTTYLGIEYAHPDLIISIGSAGGIAEQGAQIQDIFISRKIYFFDRRINGGKNYMAYGLGAYPSASIDPAFLKKENLKTGIVCTGDSFDNDPTDHAMMLKNNCQAIDMEAAGVAWVSQITHTPMIAMKGITNFVGGSNDEDQYTKNLPIITDLLAKKVKKLLEFYSAD